MSDPTAPSLPPVPPAPAALTNLAPKFAAMPSAQLLGRIAWDGPRLDPGVVGARAMLAWLR